jgi:hypothetical protein
VLLLLLRLAILPFFIAAVMYVIRHFKPRDRRMVAAAGWAMGTSLLAALAILGDSGIPANAAAAGLLGFKLFGLLALAGALWVAIYAGQLLGDRQGGYWIKAGGPARKAAGWSGMALLGLLAYNWAILHLLAIPAAGAPVGREAALRLVAQLSYSLGEEFFYRGCVQALLMAWFVRFRGGPWWAAILAAVIFTVQHVAPLSHLALFIFPGAVLFGVLFLRFGLGAAVAAHVGANMAMTLVLPRLF